VERPVFKPEFYRELASENPLGLTIHWREVEAWFNIVAWPAYKTYTYRQHKKAVRRWWARVSERDLDRTREAMDNVKLGRAQEEQDCIATVSMELPPTPEGMRMLKSIMGGKRD
jgi:hypothetical protein